MPLITGAADAGMKRRSLRKTWRKALPEMVALFSEREVIT
jgi:hypothetical protein